MSNRNYFDVAFDSFFSKKLYIDAYYSWKNYALSFLLFLSIISTTPHVIILYDFISQISLDKITNQSSSDLAEKKDINYLIRFFLEQLPEITITNGKATTMDNNKTYIYYPDSSKIFAIIDTSKETANFAEDAILMITSNDINFKLSNNNQPIIRDINIAALTKEKSFIVNIDFVISLIDKIISISNWYLFFIYMPIMIFFSFSYFLIKNILFSLMGIIYLTLTRTEFNFKNLFRLVMISSTPAIVINLICSLIPIKSDLFFNFSYLLTMLSSIFYFLFAIFSYQNFNRTKNQ